MLHAFSSGQGREVKYVQIHACHTWNLECKIRKQGQINELPKKFFHEIIVYTLVIISFPRKMDLYPTQNYEA